METTKTKESKNRRVYEIDRELIEDKRLAVIWWLVVSFSVGILYCMCPAVAIGVFALYVFLGLVDIKHKQRIIMRLLTDEEKKEEPAN